MEQIAVVPINELTIIVQNAVRAALEQLPQTQPSPEKSDRVFLPEACLITGLSKSKLYKLVMTGGIPYAKYGKRTLVFSREALLKWVTMETKPVRSASDNMTDVLARRTKKV